MKPHLCFSLHQYLWTPVIASIHQHVASVSTINFDCYIVVLHWLYRLLVIIGAILLFIPLDSINSLSSLNCLAKRALPIAYFRASSLAIFSFSKFLIQPLTMADAFLTQFFALQLIRREEHRLHWELQEVYEKNIQKSF